MIWFRACPKCKGELVQEEDLYGPYVFCLQCSYALTEGEERELSLSGSLTRQPERSLQEATQELAAAA